MALWLTNIKALLIVLAIAMTVIVIAKPFCLRFMTEGDFVRRRNFWVALTVAAFLIPNFWLFVLVAMPLLAWGAQKDPNPVAFYLLMMHVMPPNVGFQLPTILINQLFDINYYRMLSFAILIPAAWRLWRSRDKTERRFTMMDVLILSFFALQLVLLMPYESFTNTLRRGFLYFTDALVLYFVVSRSCITRQTLVESITSTCLAASIVSAIAVFESTKGWLLYTGIGTVWGVPAEFAYLFRDSVLRAQVSAGHSIQLGYIIAVGLGCWLYLSSRAQKMLSTKIIVILLCSGLLATQSRGPWLSAITIFFTYSALGPNSSRRLSRAVFISILLAGVLLVSPMSEFVVQRLPFVGTIDTGNIDYRQRLAEMSWVLIKQFPFFGFPYITVYLETMRQGQGIIDLVNVYATIAMSYGLVGLSLMMGFYLAGLWNAYRVIRESEKLEPDFSLLGVSLVACMVGTLLIMSTSAYQLALYNMFYILAGLAAGYVRMDSTRATNKASRQADQFVTPPGQAKTTRGTTVPFPE